VHGFFDLPTRMNPTIRLYRRHDTNVLSRLPA
jgi:hypothetical protein